MSICAVLNNSLEQYEQVIGGCDFHKNNAQYRQHW